MNTYDIRVAFVLTFSNREIECCCNHIGVVNAIVCLSVCACAALSCIPEAKFILATTNVTSIIYLKTIFYFEFHRIKLQQLIKKMESKLPDQENQLI
jgi:hypothetical protein